MLSADSGVSNPPVEEAGIFLKDCKTACDAWGCWRNTTPGPQDVLNCGTGLEMATPFDRYAYISSRDAPDSGFYYPAGYRISRIVKIIRPDYSAG